jgi:hypothetical protein
MVEVKEGNVIRTKALAFLRKGLVKYDFDMKVFYVNPIKGYNKTRYTVEGDGEHFKCNCQFYNKVSKDWEHPTCSHIQAVKLWNEIRIWNKKNDIQERA